MKTDFTITAAEFFDSAGVEVPDGWNPCDAIRVWKGYTGSWHVEPGDDHTMAPRCDSDAEELFRNTCP